MSKITPESIAELKALFQDNEKALGSNFSQLIDFFNDNKVTDNGDGTFSVGNTIINVNDIVQEPEVRSIILSQLKASPDFATKSDVTTAVSAATANKQDKIGYTPADDSKVVHTTDTSNWQKQAMFNPGSYRIDSTADSTTDFATLLRSKYNKPGVVYIRDSTSYVDAVVISEGVGWWYAYGVKSSGGFVYRIIRESDDTGWIINADDSKVVHNSDTVNTQNYVLNSSVSKNVQGDITTLNSWKTIYLLNHDLPAGTYFYSFDIAVSNYSPGTFQVQFNADNSSGPGGIGDSLIGTTPIPQTGGHYQGYITTSGIALANKGLNLKIAYSSSNISISNLIINSSSVPVSWSPSVDDYKNSLANVVIYGADNTGKTDATSAIQKVIDSGSYGTYFPAGVYLISSPIEFPYGTNYPYGIELNANAHIVATASMDAMFKLGEKKATPDTLPYLNNNHQSELYELTGGFFHANCLANTAIQTGTNMTGFKINSVSIDGCLTSGIHLKATSGTLAHDAILSNIRINYVHAGADESKNSIGILTDMGDWSISDSYICNVKIGILSAGYFSLSTVHLFSGWGAVPSIAIQCPGGISATNLYMDSYDTGISTLTTDGLTHATTFMKISNLFYYEYDGHDTSYPIKVIDTKTNSDINISNISYRFSSKRASDGSRVIFLRGGKDVSPSTIGITNLNISGISPVTDDNNNTNRISDMIFSGANKSREDHKVIQLGQSLKAGYGIIVAWIPAPIGPYYYVSQNFLASSKNKDILDKCYLKLYTDSNSNIVLNNLGFIEHLEVPYSNMDWCIGPVQTINGCSLYPLYLYNNSSSSVWLDPVDITPMDSGSNSFLFPYNSISASKIDSSTFIASTINGAIKVKNTDYNTQGDTSSRPLGVSAGYQYFDTTLNKPIWYTGSAWVDATGTQV